MKKLILSIALSAFAVSLVMADDACKDKGACPASKDKTCCPAAGKKEDKAGCKEGTECCKAKKEGEKPADCCKAKKEEGKKDAPKK